MAGRIDLTKFTSSWVLRPSLNRNLLSLIQPKHHYYSYTRTRIILVCVKIKVNSSFKGQAHQKWEPWKKKENCHQVWRPKTRKATACVSAVFLWTYHLAILSPFWPVLYSENEFKEEMFSAVKDVRLKHGYKPLTCLWVQAIHFTLSASMCHLWHLMWKDLWLQDAVVQKKK